MYEELTKEIEKIQQDILRTWDDWKQKGGQGSPDFNPIALRDNPKPGSENALDSVKAATIMKTMPYMNVESPCGFLSGTKDPDVVEAFLKGKALYHFATFDAPNSPCVVKVSSLPDTWKELIENLHAGLADPVDGAKISLQDLQQMLHEISRLSVQAKYQITNPQTGEILETLYTPEDKLLAMDVIKAWYIQKSQYDIWFAKIKQVLGNSSKYSQQDLNTILAGISKAKE